MNNRNNNLKSASSFKMKYCTIEKEVLIRNFIPCYSNTTVTDVNGVERLKGTVGMYDTATEQFYTNNGSGTFGYEALDGTYVAPKNN